MKNVNTYLIGAVAYIGYTVGGAAALVGRISSPAEVYTWDAPFIILLVLGLPFVLGFLAGRDSK